MAGRAVLTSPAPLSHASSAGFSAPSGSSEELSLSNSALRLTVKVAPSYAARRLAPRKGSFAVGSALWASRIASSFALVAVSSCPLISVLAEAVATSPNYSLSGPDGLTKLRMAYMTAINSKHKT